VRRALPAAVIAAAALALLGGCGLEYLAYLTAPYATTQASPSTPIFRVRNPTRSAEELPVFRGFELYYKFFSSGQSGARDLQMGLSTREQLVSTYGFKRMCTEGTVAQAYPFIPVAPADRGDAALEADLDFNLATSSSTPDMTYNGSVALIYPYGTIRRSAVDAFDNTKSFAFEDFDPGDADLTGINWIEFGSDGILDLVVYAISYGVQDYSPVYSDARCLGYMSYHF
jgi:hypothetical protein